MLFVQVLCLAANIYHEARGEPVDGQILVAEVTITRSIEREMDICSVVMQKDQFSWTKTLSDSPFYDTEAFMKAVDIAGESLTNGCTFCIQATHYHTKDVRPYWADDLVFLGQYGNHLFYREE